jgi:nucleoside-diphosphate-sugar epimerase
MEKTIIITGASGYLGRHLIEVILQNSKFSIAAMTSRPDTLNRFYKNEPRVKCYGNSSLLDDRLPIHDCFGLVHLAFARRFSTDEQIASSIEFSRHLFKAARDFAVPRVIYISSQGIYGNTEEIRTVNKTPPAPAMIYTMAKYATEQLLKAYFDNCTETKAVSIRLDSLAGNQRMLPEFVRQSIENRHISVVGGSQIFSFLDVRDAAGGLVALLETDATRWKPIYNLGWNEKRYNIMQLAEITAQVAKEYGFGEVTISLEKKDIKQFAGMDSSLFLHDTGWYPKYDIYSIISKLFDEYLAR